MVVSTRKTFSFESEELAYPFVAQFLHDWVLDLRDRIGFSGPWNLEGSPWGNEIAFKDSLSRFADAFKHLAEDNATVDGQPPWVEQALHDFATQFTHLWRN